MYESLVRLCRRYFTPVFIHRGHSMEMAPGMYTSVYFFGVRVIMVKSYMSTIDVDVAARLMMGEVEEKEEVR